MKADEKGTQDIKTWEIFPFPKSSQ